VPRRARRARRYVAQVIAESAGGGGGEARPFYSFLESCLRHKAEMVIFEAARAICAMRDVSTRELAPAVTVLQLFLSSSKPVLRFAAVRTLNKARPGPATPRVAPGRELAAARRSGRHAAAALGMCFRSCWLCWRGRAPRHATRAGHRTVMPAAMRSAPRATGRPSSGAPAAARPSACRHWAEGRLQLRAGARRWR